MEKSPWNNFTLNNTVFWACRLNSNTAVNGWKYLFGYTQTAKGLIQIKLVKNSTQPLSPSKGRLRSQCINTVNYAHFCLSVIHQVILQNHSSRHIIYEELIWKKLVVENKRKTSMAICIFMHDNTISSVWSSV